LIKERTFSFYYAKFYKPSYVDFGSPDPKAMQNSRDLKTIRLLDDFFWSTYSQGVAFGDLDN
jgi:hypothetical protein